MCLKRLANLNIWSKYSYSPCIIYAYAIYFNVDSVFKSSWISCSYKIINLMVKSTFISFTQWECQNFLHIFKDGCQHIHQWCVDVFFKFTFVCVYCETSIFSYLEICLYIMIPKSVYSSYWAAVWTQLPGHRVQVLRATVRKGDRRDAMWTEWNFSLCGRKVYGRPHTDLFLTYCRKEKDFVLFIVMLHATWLHLFTRSCRALLRWATFCSNCSHLYQT